MNFPHLHLLLNHFPIIGMIVAFALFAASFFGKNDDLRRGSYIAFAGIALISIPTFLSGVSARMILEDHPGVSTALMARHEGSAMLSIWFMEITGGLALAGLWQAQRLSRPARWNVFAVLVFSLLTLGLMARTGNTGGDIMHPEIRSTPTVTDTGISALIAKFEPDPDKFSYAMTFSTVWWGCMMASHFIGLVLFVGTVGLLDLRIMGFLKRFPIAPLHRFMPWAMVGLGINIVTGLFAFIGQKQNYVFNPGFWLKMLALMLFGLNAAVFYLTGTFERIEHLEAGEDAPPFAKLVAGFALFLCFALLTLGRYIQPIGESYSLK